MLTTNVDLAALMATVQAGFPFTQDRYPNGDLGTPEKTRAFAVRHSSVHMAKTGGQIAAEAEKYDHGNQINEAKLKIAVAKMLVNTLNLANILGVTAEELQDLVPQVMR